MKENHKNRGVELVKDILIVFLTCSAVWLAAKTQLLGPLNGLLYEENTQTAIKPGQNTDRAGGIVPMTMVVNLPNDLGPSKDGEHIRMGVFHDQLACQELFRKVAGSLIEVLSSAGMLEEIDRAQWEQALTEQLGVYMDFQGEIPMSVLAGWLTGGSTHLEGDVRRIILAPYQDSVSLYYRNEQDKTYYRTDSKMADLQMLSNALSAVTNNGVYYAFESEEYRGLDPDTLLFSDSPDHKIYTVSNPMNGGEESLRALVEELGFPPNSTSFYSTDEQVARNGDDNVRLSDHGVAEYTTGDGVGVLPILHQDSAGQLFDSVETCRQVAVSVMGSRCGEARIYLMGVERQEDGLEVDFGYSLNGVPVHLEGGYAARFLVADGRIHRFTMRFRSYTASDNTLQAMPLKQAMAAYSAMGLDGEELLVTYFDKGGDTLTAGWAARGDRTKGE